MQIRQVDWDDAASVELRAAQRVEVDGRYGDSSEPGPIPTGDDVTAFFVAFDDDGTPMGCAGLRPLDDTHGEIKRMFVHPAHRGSGVSRALLEQLENAAREAGWQRIVLETGLLQPDAMGFYAREGFARIPNYGYYEGESESVCFEKLLAPVDPAASAVCEGCE
jgi:putative acetyltransferase